MKRPAFALAAVLLTATGLAVAAPGDHCPSGPRGDEKITKSCTFKGKKLFGKVKVVTSFPDFKVKAVESFPDIKVKMVESFPDACGKWQMVESFPDFTIQYVDSFPDFSIKHVESFPGLP